jgi:hypothetical protein
MGIGAIGRPLNAHPAPIVIAVAAPVAAGGFIDHAVLNDASLLPAPNPAPLAVAAYDD